MASRLYIATRDIREGGGVPSKARFLYSIAESNGYNPCLVFNNLLDRDTQVRLTNAVEAIGYDASKGIVHTEIDGIEVKMIPLVFPEIEFGQYLLNDSGWRDAIRDGDLFFAVGGTNQCCLPLVRQNKRFGSWTGTLLWEDRVDRLNMAGFLERFRDRLSRPILERIERRGYFAAEPIFVVSEYTKNRIAHVYGIDRNKIDVVPFPIDTTQYSPAYEGEKTNSSTVLFAGRYSDPRKNIQLLIEAFDSVQNEIPEAELILIGDTPNKRLKNLITRHNLSDSIKLPGKVPSDDLPDYYNQASVFVIPSNQEGLGIVGLEAMACGKPVVATRCGGPEQYVRHDETGLLIDRGDAQALTDSLTRLLRDDDYRLGLGNNARKLIEKRYDAEEIGNRFVDVLANLEGRVE